MLYTAEHGQASLAICGDIMPSRRLAIFREPEFLALRKILRSADACFANLESMVVRYGEGTRQARTQANRIYPVDMGFGQPRAQRGRPMLADGELGKAILERIARVSASFGTIMRQQAGHAVISLEQSFRSEPCQISN